uniref:Uncharacterized protein n=1 Tax=Sphaerodactylus townsendi TaxID=933632 RepID=A0ACB8FAN4_9SAUR
MSLLMGKLSMQSVLQMEKSKDLITVLLDEHNDHLPNEHTSAWILSILGQRAENKELLCLPTLCLLGQSKNQQQK